MKREILAARAAFPDLHFAVMDIIAEGDRVAFRTTMHGTHNGPWHGMPPTGKSFVMEQMHIVRMDAEGCGTDHWAVFDTLGMLQQLGVIPARSPVTTHETPTDPPRSHLRGAA